jgi:beta-lysine 5,6-aminomutase beta subunit
MAENLTRPLVVLGAAIGSDAHTVGIDAIMNMKGYAGDYGLERYPMFKAHNLRSQISTEHLLEKAAELKADAVLISQVVTQRDAHIKNMKDFIAAAKADKRIAKEVIFIVGGPRIEHGLALKHGFDAGFGHGTKPSHVASFIVREYMKRHGMKEKVLEEVPTGQPAEVLQKHHEHKEGHGGRRRRGRRGGRRFRKKHHEAKGE